MYVLLEEPRSGNEAPTTDITKHQLSSQTLSENFEGEMFKVNRISKLWAGGLKIL